MTPQLALLAFLLGAVLVALLLWPRRGLWYRFLRRLGRSDAVLGEDALKLMLHGRVLDEESLARELRLPPQHAKRLVGRLAEAGLIATEPGLTLSEPGRIRAIQLVRAHRLWERYLADRTGVAEEEWHEEAERQEHLLTPAETERLAARMGRPLLDPHGDPIPQSEYELPELEGGPLSEMAAGRSGEIVHLEDEPAESFRRLLDAGLALGQRLDVLEGGERVRLRVEGREGETQLSGTDAAGVTVREHAGGAGGAGAARLSLASLRTGQSARVVGLSNALRGPQRRRLLDLGFVPGTLVRADLRAATGDPMAYRVRGALIALRREQAGAVLVERAGGGAR
jgi:DtxR family Mn-dependent transcriptional regulator